MSRLFIAQTLINAALSEADIHYPHETGGVLLGVSDGPNVWIEHVIGPGPGAQHFRAAFIPDSDFHASEISRCYEESGRRISYLGDWHTHPNASPRLSHRDRRTLHTIAREPSARQKMPLMLIFGYGDPWKALAHRYVAARACGLRIKTEVMDVTTGT